VCGRNDRETLLLTKMTDVWGVRAGWC